MSWFHLKKDYENILKKEIEVEEKFNPNIPSKKKHRHILDLIDDKKEEE